MHMRLYRSWLVLLVLLWSLPIQAAHAEDLVVYLKPRGNDKSDGLTRSSAVGSLQVAIDRALAQANKHSRLLISVLPGDYVGQHAVTSGSPDGKPLVIMPTEAEERPRFNGAGKGGTWLILENSSGKPTRLTIDGLEIINYVTAISLNGKRTDPAASNSENVIRNNIFKNIGQIAYPQGKISTAAIRLVNSDYNTIAGNHFENIRNITGCGALHSIYIAHYSTHNLVSENIFRGGCGATIKVRDASNYNTIRANRFYDQDANAILLDSYCNRDERRDCTKASAECPSWGNLYEYNKIEVKSGSRELQPVQVKTGNAPSECSQPGSATTRVKELHTEVIR